MGVCVADVICSQLHAAAKVIGEAAGRLANFTVDGEAKSCTGMPMEQTKPERKEEQGGKDDPDEVEIMGKNTKQLQSKSERRRTKRMQKRAANRAGEEAEKDLLNVEAEGDGDVAMTAVGPGTGWKVMKATVDSGAAHSVFNGDDWPMIPREESEGSRRGQVYLGPGCEKIPNRGQKRLKVRRGKQ